MAFEELLAMEFLGNTVFQYLVALIVFVLSVAILRIFKFVIIRKLKLLSKKTQTVLDDLAIQVIDDIHWPFYLLISVFVGFQFLSLPEIVTGLVFFAIMVTGAYYIVKALQNVIDFLAGKFIEQRKKTEKETDTTVIDLLGNILKGLVWIFAIFLVLSNLGIDITPIIAGLGIGGVAIAFAFQNVLKDVFASFSIYFDKPFKKGDFIVVGNQKGTVKKIGIKSTRIKSLDGPEIIISNQELTDSIVINYKKMEKRRVSFEFGVTYNTPLKKMQKIPVIVEKAVRAQELTEFNRAHFKEFGDFSLNFSVVFQMKSSDYAKYMDAKQAINMEIMKAFEKEKIEFAFPTQSLYIEKVNMKKK